MTYNAQNSSLDALLVQAGLERIDKYFVKNAFRKLFGSKEFQRGWNADLPHFQHSLHQAKAVSQIKTELEGYCRGDCLTFQQDIHDMDPIGCDIWELKSYDVRIIGWFAAINSFIAHFILDKNALIHAGGHKAYGPFVEDTVQFRNNIKGLPPHISGTGLRNVLTNRIR